MVALAVVAIVVCGGSAGAATLSGPRGIVPARTPASRVFGMPLRAGPRPMHGRVVPTAASATIPKLDYHAGSVMHRSRVYTIFWQPEEKGVSLFETSPSYKDVVNAYFERVAHDSHRSSNVYSVAAQYYSGAENHIEYASNFGGTTLDTDPLPTKGCEDEEVAGTPLAACLTEEQLANEIAKVIEAEGWPTGPESIYVLYTPQGVGSCFEAGESSTGGELKSSCSYNYYCAYHSNFTLMPGSREVIWANMPYQATETCDDGARPESSNAGPAIDTSSHEYIEAITDPTGEGWWDGNEQEEKEKEPRANPDFGEEIGDLCVLSTFSETYGSLLGGSEYNTPGAFDQVIDAHNYLLQQEWSDAAGVSSAGKTPGGCVQLLLPALIASPGVILATQQTHFDGTTSGTAEDPVVTWSWDFGDGSAGEGATPAHTYAEPGNYAVTLTVQDANGNSNTITRQVHVAPVPPPEEHTTTSTTTSSTSTAVLTTTATTTNTTSAPANLSSAEPSTVLGLPSNDASLPGLGVIALGRATCPPACALSVSLYATVHTTKHHHRTTRRLLVGAAHIVVASGAVAPIVVKLNATGRALLRRSHRLVVQLVVAATDQQSVTTKLTRILTLRLPDRRAVHLRH